MLNITGVAALAVSAFVPLGIARAVLGLILLALKFPRRNSELGIQNSE